MRSLRRRRLIVAGSALLAVPERAELCASGSGGKERLIVSGRILGIPNQLVVSAKRDDKGVLQANFDITLMRAAVG